MAREAALPNRGAMEGSNSRGDIRLICVLYTSNSERGVEVLSDLGNYPITHGPSVNPSDVSVWIGSFDENDGAEGSEGLRQEVEEIFVGRVSAGEQSHQKLLRRRTMEPPLQV